MRGIAAGAGVAAGGRFTMALFDRLLDEEYGKLLRATDRDVHDDSKPTTLPIARAIVEAYVREPVKPPWYIDLLNLNLDNHDLGIARQRIAAYLAAFERDGSRITANLDFDLVAALGQRETKRRTGPRQWGQVDDSIPMVARVVAQAARTPPGSAARLNSRTLDGWRSRSRRRPPTHRLEEERHGATALVSRRSGSPGVGRIRSMITEGGSAFPVVGRTGGLSALGVGVLVCADCTGFDDDGPRRARSMSTDRERMAAR